jgi:acyl-CoA synthetase (AMP-forming)/AMP-acid ligase II
MRRYFNRPEANAQAFRDGWFHTGDLARMDAEGYLYIIDRKKDMVVTGGYNVYCKEVERALAQHPAIIEAAVVGGARFALRRGARRLHRAAPRHAALRRKVHFVDSLPRNSLGKLLKDELRKQAATQSSRR